MIGANIQTPLTTGGSYALHNDTGHEPMGINSLEIVNGDLRVVMNFTAKNGVKVNAEDVVINSGSFWISGIFLV